MTRPLTKTETKLFLEAASGSGVLAFPETMKPITRERLLGRLEVDGLIVAGGRDGSEPRLSPAGYRIVGLRPPRRKDVPSAEPAVASPPTGPAMDEAPRAATKRALIAEMLARDDGASLADLIAATGWLPHTTRAALSRVRSAGTPLAKSKREDGVTVYRILLEEPAPAGRARTIQPEAESAAT